MALNEDKLALDPHLARLMAAAGGEAPPPERDAAILAAARREVSARPRAAGGGGGAHETPLPRARRNWYVPVSIAAVLVLSVSLVTLVHEEKGDELAQAPSAESAARKALPPTAQAPAVAASAPPAASPAEARRTQDNPGALADATSVRGAGNKVTKPTVDRARDATAASAPPEPAADKAAVAAPAAMAAGDGQVSGAAAPPPPAPPATPRQAEPFPGMREREANATVVPTAPSAPTRPAADAAATRMRSEASPAVRGTLQEAPAAKSAAAPVPRTEDTAQVPPAAARPAMRAAPAPGAVTRSDEKPAPVWVGLENQPAEKWLERLAEFRREGRHNDAETLLNEFRRRFPDHPIGIR